MTVITTRSDVSFCLSNSSCTVCGKGLWPPFVEWLGHTNILICGEGCFKIRQGLTADMAQCVAIVEINRHSDRGLTLVRKSVREIEEASWAKNRADVLGFKPPSR